MRAMKRRRGRSKSARGGWRLKLPGLRLHLRRPKPPLVVGLALAAGAILVADAIYQIARKPTEIVGMVVPSSTKTPRETWEEYGQLFRKHSTEIVRPELLAALVQAESAGDPLARTYWKWRWTWNPLDIYGPASSAVGILQITDGTFADARRYCIHQHAVAREGPFLDPDACWFNGLYLRTVPSHSIEMTSAWLHEGAIDTLARLRISRATLAQKERLATVIHLCGRERGAAFARRGFRALQGERCGDHDLGQYLARVGALMITFALMNAAG